MNYNDEKYQKIIDGKAVTWNIGVGVFEPAMIYKRLLPSELKYWKLKVVLN